MKIYLENNNVNIIQSISSASTMISSVTGDIRDYITAQFPRGFFKSEYIDTANTIAAQNKNRINFSQLNKLPCPSLHISPEISIEDPTGIMGKSHILSSPNLFLFKDLKNRYDNVLRDSENKWSIYYTSDYVSTNIYFKITVNKYMQNINLLHYLNSHFQNNFSRYLNDQYMSIEIPKTIIKIIAKLKGWDLTLEADMISMEKYLIEVSNKGEDYILKKKNLSTGQTCFFFNEKVNYLIEFSDLDAPGTINMEGMEESEYTISFKIQTSCWMANSFIFSIDTNRIRGIEQSELSTILETSVTLDENDETLSTIAIKAPEITMLRRNKLIFDGKNGAVYSGNEISHAIFTVEANSRPSDIPILKYITKKYKKNIVDNLNYMLSNNVNPNDLIKVAVYTKEGTILEDSGKFSLSYEGYGSDIDNLVRIVFANDYTTGYDIAISIYINNIVMNAITKARKTDGFFSQGNALTKISVTYQDNNDTVMVPVYRFGSANDYYSKDVMKSLRIMTRFGIGYVGLEDCSDNETGIYYRVCIGVDKNKSPIIKQLQIL